MGYVEKNLQEGETIVHHSKLHWFIYFWPIFVMASAPMLGASVQGAGVIAGTLFWFGFLWLVGEWIIAKTSEFVITNRRLIIKTGLLKRRLVETTLAQVTGISADQGMVARMLNFGTVEVKTLSGSYGPFIRIKNPEKFKNSVQEQMSMVASSQAVSSPAVAEPNVIEGLEKLAKLRSDGALTDVEFETQKVKLLD